MAVNVNYLFSNKILNSLSLLYINNFKGYVRSLFIREILYHVQSLILCSHHFPDNRAV
jgi:hypothetical protein